MPGYHKQRTEKELMRVISRIITYEAHDPLISDITVTRVEMSPDLKYAKIYVSILKENDEEQEKSFERLKKASKFLRSRLAQKMDLRFAPELHFKLDDSIEAGFRIQKILKKIEDE